MPYVLALWRLLVIVEHTLKMNIKLWTKNNQSFVFLGFVSMCFHLFFIIGNYFSNSSKLLLFARLLYSTPFIQFPHCLDGKSFMWMHAIISTGSMKESRRNIVCVLFYNLYDAPAAAFCVFIIIAILLFICCDLFLSRTIFHYMHSFICILIIIFVIFFFNQ